MICRKKITAILILLVLDLMVATYSRGSDLHIEPSITLSGEYNDNILLEDNDEITDYITRVILGLGLDYTSLRTELDILYAPEYRYFVNHDDYSEEGAVGDKEQIVHYLNALGKYTLINNLLYIEASDVYERVSLSTRRDYTRLSLFVNQSDQNTFKLNPYFVLRPNLSLTINSGYLYIDVRYDNDEGLAMDEGYDRINNIVYTDFIYETSANTNLITGYRFLFEEYETDSNATDFEKHDVYIGGSYEYSEGSSFSLRVGYTVLDYMDADSYEYPFWNAGIVHQFSSLVTSIETDRDYDARPTGNPEIVDRYRLVLQSLTYRAFSEEMNTAIPEDLDTIIDPENEGQENDIIVDQGRTTFNLFIYLNGFTDTTPGKLDTISYSTDYDAITYGTTASLYHYFSSRSIGNIGFTAEVEEEREPETYSRIYLAGVRLIYLMTRDISLALVYAYTDSYSPDIDFNNFQNNRIIATIKKTF